MKSHRFPRHQRGQALIFLVLGIVGLVSVTGLAIDGGAAFSDRRHAQNAADNAALAAALAMVNEEDLYAAAYDLAASNGYDNDGVTNKVEVHNPPTSGPYAGDEEYVQVIITSYVDTSLGKVVGWEEIVNRVEAVARGKPTTKVEMFDGHAVVSLAQHECKAFFFNGSASLTIYNSGIFVNSDCPSDAFFNRSGSIHSQLTAPYLYAVGGITYRPEQLNVPTISSGVEQYPYPPSWLPDVNELCDASNTMDDLPSDDLSPGIYCLTGDLHISAHTNLTGTGVTIVLLNGGLHWTGRGTVNISAPDSGPTAGLLIYAPLGNTSNITINGHSESSYVGSVLAPSANCKINGTSNNAAINSQLVCYTIEWIGTSDTVIYYVDAENYDAVVPPEISIAQ